MSTQLHLVDPPKSPAPRASGRARASISAAAKSTKAGAGAGGARDKSRRPANWGDWQLDARTRRVGRAGVAAARRALEEARAAQELRRAS